MVDSALLSSDVNFYPHEEFLPRPVYMVYFRGEIRTAK